MHRVYGITDFSQRVEFEKRVPLEHTSFIDVYIPETHVVIEQKSLGIDLLKRKKQSDGSELNPFEQARRYGGAYLFRSGHGGLSPATSSNFSFTI